MFVCDVCFEASGRWCYNFSRRGHLKVVGSSGRRSSLLLLVDVCGRPDVDGILPFGPLGTVPFRASPGGPPKRPESARTPPGPEIVPK